MSKPTSGISSAVSIRISNELLEAVKGYAIANKIINTSGRNDDRGKPNLSQAFSELVSVALGLNIVSDSVSSPDNDDLRDSVKKLYDTVLTLSDRLASVENAIATSTSEATSPEKKPTNIDNLESEALPIIAAIEAIAIVESPAPLVLSQRDICNRFKINYSNLSTIAGKNNMRPDAYISHIAKEHGEIWEKAASKGSSKQWILIKILTP